LLRLFPQNGILANYFKVAFRNLVRHKSFSLINISGLAIGMAAAILILLWVQNDLSIEQFHENKDRIYIIFNRTTYNGKIECSPGIPSPLSTEIKSSYPQIEQTARINGVGPFVLTVGDKHFEASGMMTDPGFLKMFSFPLIRGNVGTVLNSPRSMVVTEKFARKIFPGEDAMGKVIRIDSNAYFTIGGILKDLPNNTKFDFEYLVPWTYKKEVGWDNPSWSENGTFTIVMLKSGITETAMNQRLRDILKKRVPGSTSELFLHPLIKWHLYSRFENGKIAGGEIEIVRLFTLVAVFILLIACINYMNLSTARSIKRAREVGIRKVVGARKMSIVLRFLGESVMIACMAGIISLVLVQLTIRGFSWLSWKELFVPYGDPYFWLALLGFVLFTGLLAGSYPALYLSTFRPIAVLKGTFKTAYSLVNIRKLLVVLQFSFAIIFIICTIIIYRQIEFGSRRDPGYNRDNLAFVYVKGDVNKKYPLIKHDMLASGAAISVTRSNSPITYSWQADDSYSWQGKNPRVQTFFEEFHADNDFLETMGMRLTSGRSINTDLYPTDSTAVLLTESAVKTMGFDHPVGQIISSKQGNWTVVGTVKDFVPGSPLFKVQPIIIQGPKNWFGVISFRMNKKYSIADNIKKVESIFKKYNPEYPFIYRFVDEADAEKMEGERRIGIQAGIFGGLAILISCLGLFALAAYSAENRIKEIGVRKVLGASAARIAALLSGDFLKLVLISFLVASPLAWWAMHAWLEQYTYRVNISWWIFLITGMFSMLIAVITISYQAIRAALANPVASLRTA